MNILTQIALVIVALYVFAEVCAGIYIYRNRTVFLARLRNLFRGKEERETMERIERKINYIGRHVKFEREQLRKLGILREENQEYEARQATPETIRLHN